jgi:anti-sigma regulatory factor (Ser/Thr protein kinase)
MRASEAPAAMAAARRARECQLRVAELAERRAFTPIDVSRAREALASARERADTAQRRCSQAQRRRMPSNRSDSARVHATAGVEIDAARLRRRVGAIRLPDLYPSYFALGGACSAFELEAFVNGALELPPGELANLSQAVWEVAEFGPEFDLREVLPDGPPAVPLDPDVGEDEVVQQSETGVFIAEPAAARRARRWLGKRLDDLRACDSASLIHDDAMFVVSQLVANAVKANATTVCVTVDVVPGSLRIEVTDDAPSRVSLTHTASEASSGRGLALVVALVAELHVVPKLLGKKVSVTLDISPGEHVD